MFDLSTDRFLVLMVFNSFEATIKYKPIQDQDFLMKISKNIGQSRNYDMICEQDQLIL